MKARGYHHFIVVDISGVGINRRPDITGTGIVCGKNSIDMGGLLDFTPHFIKNFTSLGYLDTKKVLGDFRGLKYCFIPDDALCLRLNRLTPHLPTADRRQNLGDGGILLKKTVKNDIRKIKEPFLSVSMVMRKTRELHMGAEYHVTAKINREEFALQSVEIKELFLHIVKRAKEKFSFKLRNFTIMSNHIHFLIKPEKDESLSRIMQWILSVFAKNYNKLFRLKGHVWYDRFTSTVIRSYRQLLATFRYICNNPVKAQIVKTPEAFEYGGLWHIRQKRYDIAEPPDQLVSAFLSDLF